MADIAELGFKVDSNPLAKANDELEKLPPRAANAERAADKFNREVAQTGAVSKAASGGLNTLTTAVARLAAGVAAYFSVSALISYADAWSDMQSRIGAAIKDMDAAPAMMQRIVDIANASYSPLAQTAEIYSRNVGVLKALGLGAAQAADYTESLNHMLVITATRGERAESVQNALSKAMALGKLTGEGLESVLANGGRVAEALADELGTTVNGLRGMASEGKITAQVIANALLKSLEDVRVEAGEMTATVADAFVIMNNNITAAIGQFDKATGVSATLASGIIFLAENLDIVGIAIAGIAAGITVALIPAIVGATAAAWAFTAALLANPLTAVALVIALLTMRIITLVQQVGGLGNAFQHVQMTALDVWERIKAGAQSMGAFLDGIGRKIDAAFTGAFANIAEGFSNLVGSMGSAAGLIGLDSSGIAGYVAGLKSEVEGFEKASTDAFDAANKFWQRATGPGLQMDIVQQGAGAWNDFATAMGAANDNATATATSVTAVGTAAAGAAPKIATVSEAVKAAFDAAKEQWDFYKNTFNSFISNFKNELKSGSSLWDSFASAASKALDSIADRALSMAANGIFDMIFGAFMGNTAGPGWGVMGGFGKPGMFGLPGFADGGYTGNGAVTAAAGITHGKEFVMNAAATQAIGVQNLQSMNDNGVLPSNDNGSGFVYQDNRSYDFSGSGMTREEIEDLMEQDRQALLADMPNIISSYQRDPRKRKAG